jgi:hypothetical protein
MNSGNETPAAARRESGILLGLYRGVIAACLLSTATLPFIGKVWLGEIPVLVITQVPKVTVARWLREEVVMKVIRAQGWSSGSFSPDYTEARTWGLLLAYLPPVMGLFLLGWWRWRHAPCSRRMLPWIFLAVAVLDFYATLRLTGGPGFTIY